MDNMTSNALNTNLKRKKKSEVDLSSSKWRKISDPEFLSVMRAEGLAELEVFDGDILEIPHYFDDGNIPIEYSKLTATSGNTAKKKKKQSKHIINVIGNLKDPINSSLKSNEANRPLVNIDSQVKKFSKKRTEIETLSEIKRQKFDVSDQPFRGTYRMQHWVSICPTLYPNVLSSLARMNFSNPTAIQQQVIPMAVSSDGLRRRDIIGAAETGSGKTLAFGIPVICNILSDISKEEELVGSKFNILKPTTWGYHQNKRLRALIISPTRELAMQIVDHLTAVTLTTPIKISAILGGLSEQKQKRLLSKFPHIVVGTPGRLWELIEAGNACFRSCRQGRLSFLVLDEADRLVERGHYVELYNILNYVKKSTAVDNGDQFDDPMLNMNDIDDNSSFPILPGRTQIFLFSATMMLERKGTRGVFPISAKTKKGLKSSNTNDTTLINLTAVLDRLAVEKNPLIIDVAKERQNNSSKISSTLDDQASLSLANSSSVMGPASLSHLAVQCPEDMKDAYLYYFLSHYNGRTLIFVNAISCLRRLVGFLSVLQLPVFALHANMQQRQRLKYLDKFKSFKNGILVCTDVAARGLDIPVVDYVVHFQLPRTPEIYIHRSGRCARAGREGTAVSIVGPADNQVFSVICKTLKMINGLPSFNVDQSHMPLVRKRLTIALKIDKLIHLKKKNNSEKQWYKNAAEAMDIELDDDILASDDDDDDDVSADRFAKQRQDSKQLQDLRQELQLYLDAPLGMTVAKIKITK